MNSAPLPLQALEKPPDLPARQKNATQTLQHTFRTLAVGILLGLAPSARAGDMDTAKPIPTSAAYNGSLVIAGGGVLPPEIQKRFVELAGGEDAHIVIIPTASEMADRPEQRVDWYWKGEEAVASATILHTRSRLTANLPDFVRPLEKATGVWIPGGIQDRLADAYLETLVVKRLHDLLKRGGVIGGTSAGAAVMSRSMIRGGNPIPTLGQGFGLLPNCVIDQHFRKRNREQRLRLAVELFPECIGVGIDEGAAAVFRGDFVANPNISAIGTVSILRHNQSEAQVLKDVENVDLNILAMPSAAAGAGGR